MSMKKVVQVKPCDGFTLKLAFDDGVEAICDLAHLAGRGVFEMWRDEKVFQAVKIGANGELVWPGDIDLCPDALYLRVRKQSPETLFPLLDREIAHT